MSKIVTVVVSAGGASYDMLTTCLNCLKKYENETSFDILVVAATHQALTAAEVCHRKDMNVKTFFPKASLDEMSGSRIHAEVLDKTMHYIKTPYVLTLDADCFPMRNGWLDLLMEELKAGAAVAGITHPYAPPPTEMSKTSMDYRIRSQLCWTTTHVACQLIAMETLKKLGVGFADGDDTGLAIPKAAKEAGLEVSGMILSKCAMPEGEKVPDPEMNREYCLIYEDYIYHHGGGSREYTGKDFPSEFWGKTRKRVIAEGPEFLLEGGTYEYRYDDEEKVAAQMVKRIMDGMQIYLQSHNAALKE